MTGEHIIAERPGDRRPDPSVKPDQGTDSSTSSGTPGPSIPSIDTAIGELTDITWGTGSYLNIDSPVMANSHGDAVLSDSDWGDIVLAGAVRVGDKVLAVYEDAGTVTSGSYTNCRVKARFVEVGPDLTFDFGGAVQIFDTGVQWPNAYEGHAYWFMQTLVVGDYVVYSAHMSHVPTTHNVLVLIDCSGPVPVFKQTVTIAAAWNFALLSQTGPATFIAYNTLSGGNTTQIIPYRIVGGALVQGTIVNVGGDTMVAATCTTDGTFMATNFDGELIRGTANPTTGAITSATRSAQVANLPNGDSGWNWWVNTSFNIAPVPGYPHAFIADNGEGDIFIANNNAGVYEVPAVYTTPDHGAGYRWAYSAGRGTAVAYDSTGIAWAVYSNDDVHTYTSGEPWYTEQYHLVRDVFGTPTETIFDERQLGLSGVMRARVGTADDPYIDRSTFTLTFTADDVGILTIAAGGIIDAAEPFGKYFVGCFRSGTPVAVDVLFQAETLTQRLATASTFAVARAAVVSVMSEPPYAFADGADPDTEEPAFDATVIPYLSDDSDATFLHFANTGDPAHDYLELYGNQEAIPSTPVTAIVMTIRGRSSGSSALLVPYLYTYESYVTYGYINYYGPLDGISLPLGTTFVETTIRFDQAALDAALSPANSDWLAYNGSVDWTTVDGFVDQLRARGFMMDWRYNGGRGTWDVSSFDMTFETVAAELSVDVLVQAETLTQKSA